MFSHDLTQDNLHLMPWRTVMEVASNINRMGHKAIVLSGKRHTTVSKWHHNETTIIDIPKPHNSQTLNQLIKVCLEEKIQLLYWPVSWLKIFKNIKLLEKNNIQILWYVPGSWYSMLRTLKAARYMGIRKTFPYLMQAAMPKHFMLHQLWKHGNRPLITMTEYTREMVIHSGYPDDKVVAIMPGKAPLEIGSNETNTFNSINQQIGNKQYFLFFGPPQAIRGIDQILRAFKYVSKINKEAYLVCLFRSDRNLNTEKMKSQIDNYNFQGRLICIWESVSGADLDAFLKNCYAVLKPFLLVPSEIPLAVIETAGYGKPVICTGPDGTGLFAKQFGIMVPSGDSMALARAMLRLLDDEELYRSKCQAAENIYRQHPTWKKVAENWLMTGGMNYA